MGVFLLVVFAPLFDHLFEIAPNIQLRENRNLAPKPETQEKFRFKRFRKQFEPYFNDHFGFRKLLLAGYNRMHYSIFKTANGVVFGADDWLFLKQGVRSDLKYPIPIIKDLCGEAPFSENELTGWRNTLLTNWFSLTERGIEYLYLPVPNKHRIYQEHLPKYGECSDVITRLDQLINQLTKITNYPIIDLRIAFSESVEKPLYFKRDTHWNNNGVAIAYNNIIDRLDGRLRLRDISSQLAFVDRQQQGGDLALMTGMERHVAEPYQAIQLADAKTREIEKPIAEYSPTCTGI